MKEKNGVKKREAFSNRRGKFSKPTLLFSVTKGTALKRGKGCARLEKRSLDGKELGFATIRRITEKKRRRPASRSFQTERN